MADFKYAKFFLNTVIKLAVFLVLCCAAFYTGGFMKSPTAETVPSVIAIVITWLFLAYAEQGKRSFFSKGYMTENLVVGGMFGIGVILAAAGAAFITGNVTVSDINTDFDITKTFLETVYVYLWAGIVFYGYFFHIVQKDFGSIPAVIISSLLFTLYNRFITSAVLLDTSLTAEEGVALLNIFLIGIAAGMMIVFQGDMRSACSFLFFLGLCKLLIERGRSSVPLIIISGNLGMDGLIFTVIMIVIIITLLIQTIKTANDR